MNMMEAKPVKKVDGITRESTQAMIDRTLEAYPTKGKAKRAPHLAPNDQASGCAAVKSNKKTVPGVMSARGCAYAGAKGVVWGPIRDMVHVSHGPVGCGWYSWGTRRNLMTGKLGVDQFAMQFTSDFQEKDIVYGGDKKLKQLLIEAEERFLLAKGISVPSECLVGRVLAGREWSQCQIGLDRRRRAGQDCCHPYGKAEPDPLLPLHELYVQ